MRQKLRRRLGPTERQRLGPRLMAGYRQSLHTSFFQVVMQHPTAYSPLGRAQHLQRAVHRVRGKPAYASLLMRSKRPERPFRVAIGVLHLPTAPDLPVAAIAVQHTLDAAQPLLPPSLRACRPPASS